MSILDQAGALIWPRSGFRRTGRYLVHRVKRLPGTPYAIAAGFASGAAVSFLPLVGLHFILGAILAFTIRANVIASAIGTAIGNPWTFPFIFLWAYKLGAWLLGPEAMPSDQSFELGEFIVQFGRAFGLTLGYLAVLDVAHLKSEVWPLWRDVIWPIWWPMMVGGVPTALFVWCLIYFPLRRLVAGYQARRVRKMAERRATARQRAQKREERRAAKRAKIEHKRELREARIKRAKDGRLTAQ